VAFAVIFPGKANDRMGTTHVRTSVRRRSEVIAVRIRLVAFEVIPLPEAVNAVLTGRNWTLVWSVMLSTVTLAGICEHAAW